MQKKKITIHKACSFLRSTDKTQQGSARSWTSLMAAAALFYIVISGHSCSFHYSEASSSPLPTAITQNQSPDRLVAIGWKFYNNGKLNEAENFFKAAVIHPGIKHAAMLSALSGLGYTELKLKNFNEAQQHFSRILSLAGKQDATVIDKAAEGLFLASWESGHFEKAWSLLMQNTNRAWSATYTNPETEIPLCINADDLNGALGLFRKYYRSDLIFRDNKKSQVFLSLLYYLNHKKVDDPALCSQLMEYGLSKEEVTTCIKRLKTSFPKDFSRLMLIAQRKHPSWFNEPSGSSPRLAELRSKAGRAFNARDYSSALEYARKALELSNGDRDMLAVAAWSAYHLEKYKEAEGLFRKGSRLKNSSPFKAGLAWSLIKQGKCRDAANLLENEPSVRDQELLAPMLEALRCAGYQYYEEEKWSAAAEYFEKYLGFSPGQSRDVEELLAWSYYNAGLWERADLLFERLLEKEYRSEWVDARTRSIAMQGDYDLAWKIYSQYGENRGQDSSIEQFIHSTGLTDNYLCRFAGCENFVAAGAAYRHRSGDTGQGKLSDYSVPLLHLGYRITDNLLLRATAGHRHVTNDDSSDNFMDGYFSGTWQPGSRLEFSAGAGFTGAEALTGARALWHAGARADTVAGRFGITTYRSTVDDSLLSISGMKCNDDAKCKKWGGVSRTGALVSWNSNLGRFNLDALFDVEQLTGTSVRRNNHYLASISGGTVIKTELLDGFMEDPWAGIYSTWFRYDRNLNYYTCGNGGYFSPRSFIAAGPVVNLRTVQGKRWIAQLNSSAGYVNYIEDDGWQYPMESGQQRGWRYSGRSLNLLGYSFQGKGAMALNSHLALELRAGVEKSADFTEWQAGLNIILYINKIRGMFFDGLPSRHPHLP